MSDTPLERELDELKKDLAGARDLFDMSDTSRNTEFEQVCTANHALEREVAQLRQRIEGLEISVEGAKANATCIAKALGDVTEERNALRQQLGDLLDEMEEQLLK